MEINYSLHSPEDSAIQEARAQGGRSRKRQMFPALSHGLWAKKHHALFFQACAMEVGEAVGTGGWVAAGGAPSHPLSSTESYKNK